MPTSSFPKRVEEIRKSADEVLVQAHNSIRDINISLIRIETGDLNVEVLRKVKLHVQRLNASVFSIKVSLQESIIFEATFKFLNEGADKVIKELKKIVGELRSAYSNVADFVSELDGLIATGSRFIKMVSGFLKTVFSEGPEITERHVSFKPIAGLNGTRLNSGIRVSSTNYFFGGIYGNVVLFDAQTNKITDELTAAFHKKSDFNTINALAMHAEGLLLIGTNGGLKAQLPIIASRSRFLPAPYEERVVGVAYLPWAIATVSTQGNVREWQLAGDELIPRPNSVIHRLGTSGQRICAVSESFYVAVGENVHSLNSNGFQTKIAELGFKILDMCVVNDSSLLACGQSSIAVINIKSGTFVKLFGTSTKRVYNTVAALDETQFFVGTTDGDIYSYDGQSHIETGRVKCDFDITGLIALGQKLLVYGGAKSKGRALMVYAWNLEVFKSEAVAQ